MLLFTMQLTALKISKPCWVGNLNRKAYQQRSVEKVLSLYKLHLLKTLFLAFCQSYAK